MICNRWSVVVVPFPFSDKPGTKRRPALVLSNEIFNQHGHSILAMITTKQHYPWPGDCDIIDIASAGLKVPCIVRLKIFTLDNRLILRNIGRLTREDAEKVGEALLLGLCQDILPSSDFRH